MVDFSQETGEQDKAEGWAVGECRARDGEGGVKITVRANRYI